jgi:hypothetical protein
MEAIRMSIDGSISVTFDFNDTAASDGVDSLKKVRLSSNQVITAGGVAVLSGTVSTTVQTIDLTSLPYRDAAGELVTFTAIDIIALQSSRSAHLELVDVGTKIHSDNDKVAISCVHNTDDTLKLYTTAGTSSYIVAIHGS